MDKNRSTSDRRDTIKKAWGDNSVTSSNRDIMLGDNSGNNPEYGKELSTGNITCQQAPRVSSTGIKRVFVKHAEKTSLVGVPYIYKSSSPFTRTIWSIFLIAATGAMTYHLSTLLEQYVEYEKSTNIVLLKKDLPLPAITFCNVNPLKKSQLSRAGPNLKDILDKFKPKTVNSKVKNMQPVIHGDEGTGEPNDVQPRTDKHVAIENPIADTTDDDSDVKDPCYDIDDIRNRSRGEEEYANYENSWDAKGKMSHSRKLSKAFSNEYNKINDTTRKEMGHDIKNMLTSCSFQGRTIDPDNFTLVQSPVFGNCYTLDSSLFLVTESGPREGLEMEINLETWEYLEGVTTSKGLQLVIHEPGSVAFPEDNGIAVDAGAHTFIGLHQMLFKRLNSPYEPGCLDQSAYKLKTNRTYTKRMCKDMCWTKLIRDKCECRSQDYDMADSDLDRQKFQICCDENETSCMDKVDRLFNVKENCTCKDPCSEVKYKKTISQRKWPEISYAQGLLHECVKQNACSQNIYTLYINSTELQDNFVKLNIYFEDLNYEELQEKAQYSLPQFFSDVGGVMGLWFGLSVLGICEILHFGFDILFYMTIIRTARQQ